MANALFTFDEFKNLTGWEKDQSDYPFYELIRDGVTARIEAYLQRNLVEVVDLVEVIETDSAMIPLKHLPILSVAEVLFDDVAKDTDCYRIMAYGIEFKYPLFCWMKVSVKYTGGYDVTSGVIGVPDAIKRAALYQTNFEILNKDNPAAETISTEAGTTSKPPIQLLKEVKESLNPFRHPYYACLV